MKQQTSENFNQVEKQKLEIQEQCKKDINELQKANKILLEVNFKKNSRKN